MTPLPADRTITSEVAEPTTDDDSVASDTDCKGHDDHHAHGSKAPSLLTAAAAAAINFALMFGLSCAYGIIMFEDSWNQQHRGMGVKMNLGTAFILGLTCAAESGVPVAIGGPDLNPVVFLGLSVQAISEDLAAQHGLAYPPAGRRLLGERAGGAERARHPAEVTRRLAPSSSDVEFCTGEHYTLHARDCDAYHNQLRATTIFTVAASSLLLGVLFFCLGRFKLSRFVSYIPTNIVEAFLSCIGYKVFKYALKFSENDPRQFIPAAFVGVSMYFAKAYHVGNPAVVIPVMVLVPLLIFYTAVYGRGGDLETARGAGWMFAPLENADFWLVWSSTLGNLGDINFGAWTKTLVTLPVMVIVVTLDCMLKLSATENKMPVRPELDREMMVFGSSNLITALFGTSVGYMQLKFNVINYGVMGNVTDRRGGALYAVLCGVCYFASTDLFNYMPRFFLSTMLFFAGAGFVAENLLGSQKTLTSMDWAQVVFILAVFVLTGSLLSAVLVGGVLCCLTFLVRYGRITPMIGRPMRGGEVATNVRRSPSLQLAIDNLSNHWLLVLRLKGYLFFASAQSLTKWLAGVVQAQRHELPAHKRLRWVILDCEIMDGMDASASRAFANLGKLARECQVTVLLSAMNKSVSKALRRSGLISNRDHSFESFSDAKKFTERDVCRRISQLQRRWMTTHHWFQMNYKFARTQAAMDPFREILHSDAARFGCPWDYCKRRGMEKFKTMLWSTDEPCRDLFLVYTGHVGVFKNLPGDEGIEHWPAPTVIYTHGWFINREARMHRPAQDCAVALCDGALIYWSEEDWGRMAREQPQMTSAILEAILRQESNHAALASQQANTGGAFADCSMDTVPAPEECERIHESAPKWIRDMHVVRAMEGQGFYEGAQPDDYSKLQELPKDMLKDLDLAFYTFADSPHEASSIPASELPRACAYAGLFEARLANSDVESFGRDHFFAACHEAAMLRLSNFADLTLRFAFGRYSDSHGLVERAKLVKLFKESFHPDISAFEVNSICDLFVDQAHQTIDRYTFLAIMSRFAHRHATSWRLLSGARELMGQDHIGCSDALTAQHLVDRGGIGTIGEAEELIWFANCCLGATRIQPGGKPDSFDFRLLRGLFQLTEIKSFVLPPELKKPRGDQHPKPRATRPMGTVIDFRHLLGHGTLPHGLKVNHGLSEHESQQLSERLKVKSFEDEEGGEGGALALPRTCQQRVYQLLDEPGSSRAALVTSLVMAWMVLLSVVSVIVEPLTTPPAAQAGSFWWCLELYFTALFTLELAARFCVADAMGTQTRLDFAKRACNICDFVAVLPFYLDLLVHAHPEELRLLRALRYGILRIARLGQLARLSRHHPAFAPVTVIIVVIWGIYLRYD